jgi:hypothetical protein
MKKMLLVLLFGMFLQISVSKADFIQDCINAGGQPFSISVVYNGCPGIINVCVFVVDGVHQINYWSFEGENGCTINSPTNLLDPNFWPDIDKQVIEYLSNHTYGPGPCSGAHMSYYQITKRTCEKYRNVEIGPNNWKIILEPCIGNEATCKKLYSSCWRYINGTSGATTIDLILISSTSEGTANCTAINEIQVLWLGRPCCENWVSDCYNIGCY